MKLFLFFTTILLTCVGCQKEQKYEKFIVDRRLPANDTVQLLSKHPELKLFNSEVLESYTRTAYIVHHTFYYDDPLKGSFLFNDYKCRAQYENDTLSILLNNDNGYSGKGIQQPILYKGYCS